MDEAITAVHLRSTKCASAFGFPPQWGRANFVKGRHRAGSLSGAPELGAAVWWRNWRTISGIFIELVTERPN
jgi:hypothetical protein